MAMRTSVDKVLCPQYGANRSFWAALSFGIGCLTRRADWHYGLFNCLTNKGSGQEGTIDKCSYMIRLNEMMSFLRSQKFLIQMSRSTQPVTSFINDCYEAMTKYAALGKDRFY